MKKSSVYLFIRTAHLIYLIHSYGGSISARSFSVRCFSISNSSVRSLIRSSRFEEYCSSMRNIESMMLVFLPLFISLNCKRSKKNRIANMNEHSFDKSPNLMHSKCNVESIFQFLRIFGPRRSFTLKISTANYTIDQCA